MNIVAENLEVSNGSSIAAENNNRLDGKTLVPSTSPSVEDLLVTQGGQILVNTASELGSGGSINIGAKGLRITEGGAHHRRRFLKRKCGEHQHQCC